MKYQTFHDRKNYAAVFLVSKPAKKIYVPKFNPYLVSEMEDPLQRPTPATL